MTLDTPCNAVTACLARFLALAILLLAAVAWPSVAPAETFITVGDVPVDITAKSAAAARDQAIADAQAIAFARLIKQLVPNAADQARLKPSQADIESFVQDFAIESERTSSVRYIGRYSVRFRSSRVHDYLADAGITTVSNIQQVLVLPVYKGASGPVLWGQGNPWRAAWDRGGFGDGPVTLILPNGDAFDTATLSAAGAQSGDVAAILPLVERYHTVGVVVVEATPVDPARGPASGLAISVTPFDATGPKAGQNLTVDNQKGEQADKVLRAGVAAAAHALEAGWQQSIATTGSIGLARRQSAASGDAGADQGAALGAAVLYPIAMPIAGIAEWVKARDVLGAIPGVHGVTLDALTRGNVAFTLDFAGDSLALQTALADSGYVLVQTAPGNASGPGNFQLRRTDSSTAPVAR